MIRSKKELNDVIATEYALYFSSYKRYLRSIILHSRTFQIWKYQKALRKLEYYKWATDGGGLYNKILFAYYSRRVNSLGLKLSIDTWCNVFDEGVFFYHVAGGIVVNSDSRIGKNCHLHGNNCIGNNGKPGAGSPIIGDNCILGVGAKIIGDIRLGNNIKIAAGAVVVKSCLEDGVTLAGVPAVVIRKK